MKEEDCGHAPPFVYHIDGRDPAHTGAIKQRASYCADCAALVKDHRAGVAFDRARKAIANTLSGGRTMTDHDTKMEAIEAANQKRRETWIERPPVFGTFGHCAQAEAKPPDDDKDHDDDA
jgi:hypothetical protein